MKGETMLYRYIFRGLGILILIGMLTIFFLAVRFEHAHAVPRTPNGVERR
jgi:hypothetical protein